jgi:hypothetical protein
MQQASVRVLSTCYERLMSLSDSLNRPLLLYSALRGMWRYSRASRYRSSHPGERSLLVALSEQIQD